MCTRRSHLKCNQLKSVAYPHDEVATRIKRTLPCGKQDRSMSTCALLAVADMTARVEPFFTCAIRKLLQRSACGDQRTEARQRLFAAAAQHASVGAQHERDAADQDRARLSAVLQSPYLTDIIQNWMQKRWGGTSHDKESVACQPRVNSGSS